jgi:hypothetical protein
VTLAVAGYTVVQAGAVWEALRATQAY